MRTLRLIRRWAGLAKTHFFLGLAVKALGRYDEALERFRAAAKKDPRDRVVVNQIGRVLFLKRQYKEAIAELQKVLPTSASRSTRRRSSSRAPTASSIRTTTTSGRRSTSTASCRPTSRTHPQRRATPGADLGVRFVDVTPAAKIAFKHTSGAFGKKYLPETMTIGSRADGWPIARLD